MKNKTILFTYAVIIMFLMMIGMVMEEILDFGTFSFIFINMMWFSICFIVVALGIKLFFDVLENLPDL